MIRSRPVQIYDGLKEIGGNPFRLRPRVPSCWQVPLRFMPWAPGLFGRASHATMGRTGGAGGPRTLTPAARWACTGLFLPASLSLPCCRISACVLALRFLAPWHARCSPPDFTLENFRLALGHDLTFRRLRTASSIPVCPRLSMSCWASPSPMSSVRTRVLGRRDCSILLVMLPGLAVPGRCWLSGISAMSQHGRLVLLFQPCRESGAPAGHRLLGSSPALHGAIGGRRVPPRTSETLEEAAANLGCPPLKTDHPRSTAATDHGQSHRRRVACLRLCHAGRCPTRSCSRRKQAFYPITKADS